MPSRPAPRKTVQAPPTTTPSGVYSEATEAAFRDALAQLAPMFPDCHGDLKRLLDEGRFHEPALVIAVLERGAP